MAVRELRNWKEAAWERIAREPKLVEYNDVICYDWAEEDEHWEWVATAPIQEIVDWAQYILDEEADENALRELEEEVWLAEWDFPYPFTGDEKETMPSDLAG